MKTLLTYLHRAAMFAVLVLAVSCDKAEVQTSSTKASGPDAAQETNPFTTIIPAGQYTFTDVEVCKDGTVYLLENGVLKKLNGTQLEDVPLPASVYVNFSPKFLAVARDNTIYLRAGNGIKKIKNNNVTFYEVGVGILTDFSESDFGQHEIAFDHVIEAIYFGFGSEPEYFKVAIINKDGRFFYHYRFNTYSFDLGISRIPNRLSDFWAGRLGGGIDIDRNLSISYDRFILQDIGPVVSLTISGDGNTSAFISRKEIDKQAEIDDKYSTKVGELRTAIYDEQIKNRFFPELHVTNRTDLQNLDVTNRIALTYDGKTLYLAGDGLSKLDL